MTVKIRWKVNETEGEPVVKDCGLVPIMVRVRRTLCLDYYRNI